MLEKFYITPGQWRHILRWFLYGMVFLGAMMLQTVILGRDGLFGQHPDIVAVVIITVCMVEGPERGGLFALVTSTFWALSGIDRGALQILCLTVIPVVCVHYSSRIFSIKYIPALLSCGLTMFLSHSLSFVLKVFYEAAPTHLFTTYLLPGLLVSLLFQPPVYWLSKSIEKIGDPYEAT